MVIALLVAPPYTTENLIGVRFPMLKPMQFLDIAGAIPRQQGQSISYCPAPWPGYSPAIRVGGAWIQMSGVLKITGAVE